MLVERSPKNPILKPSENWWDSTLVCNPGVIMQDGEIHLVYSAKGVDGISRFGYAKLKPYDEVIERLSYPIFQPEQIFEMDGVEDPRLTVMGDELIMFYACKERQMARIAFSTIPLVDFVNKRWRWSRHKLLLPTLYAVHDRNAVLFPSKINDRYVMLHRPMLMSENIWISYSYDFVHWFDHKEIILTRPGMWDDAKVGAAGPPIDLGDYWLLIYHGVESRTWTYRLGYVLMDKNNPARVIYRCKEPLLEPQEDYEKVGETSNVVFSCGNVLVGDELYIYYGAADKVICMAKVKINELIDVL